MESRTGIIAPLPPEDREHGAHSGKVYERRHNTGEDVGACGRSCHALHVRDERGRAETPIRLKFELLPRRASMSVQCIALVSPKWPDLMCGPP